MYLKIRNEKEQNAQKVKLHIDFQKISFSLVAALRLQLAQKIVNYVRARRQSRLRGQDFVKKNVWISSCLTSETFDF